MFYSNKYRIKVEKGYLYYTEKDVSTFYPLNEFRVFIIRMSTGSRTEPAIRFWNVKTEMIVMETHPCFQTLLDELMAEMEFPERLLGQAATSQESVELYYRDDRKANARHVYQEGMAGLPLNGFPIIINGKHVPYEESVETLSGKLGLPIGDYVTIVCALSWHGTLDSYEILIQELKNRDYYKRRAALDYISRHQLWDNDSTLMRALVLDTCEYTVLMALKLVDRYQNDDMDEEVIEAYHIWKNHKEIPTYCEKYFARCGVTAEDIQQFKAQEKLPEENFYENTDIGQNTPWAAKSNPAKYEDYKWLIWKYHPAASEKEIDEILQGLSRFGCGYASFITALMRFYEDKPVAFFQQFGVKYFDAQGENNGDDLMVLMYAMCGMEKKGMSLSRLFLNISRFKKVYDVKVSVKQIRDPRKYLERENAYVILMTGDFTLQSGDSKYKIVKEHHYMNLVGITENGDYEVISWGKRYLLKKENIHDKVYFVGVQFE